MNRKAIPDYAKTFKKEYIFLLGIDEGFSYISNYIATYDIEKGILKEKSKWINKMYIAIKKYKECLESGVLQDLLKEAINYEAFLNIENVEMIISECLERYLDINPVGISKINKEKYEKNVDKDFPGLRKLIDTLSYYYEVIKYPKTYNLPKSEPLISFDTDSSDLDSDSDSDSGIKNFFISYS